MYIYIYTYLLTYSHTYIHIIHFIHVYNRMGKIRLRRRCRDIDSMPSKRAYEATAQKRLRGAATAQKQLMFSTA